MKLFRFVGSKTFFVNLIIMAILGGGLFWGLNYFLESYTLHQQNIQVPDLRELAVSEAGRSLEAKGLTYAVIDSSDFDPNLPRGGVVAQYPEAGSKVKLGRSIKLTINPLNPRKVELPMLVEKTKRRALYDLESKGFKIGELKYVPYIGKDVVIDVLVNGESVMPGSKFDKGTTVDLVLGQGLSEVMIRSPYLRWKSLAEVKEYLLERSLNLGSVIYDEKISDSTTALVYKQNPPPTTDLSIRMGREIDVWLTNDYTKILNDSLEFQLNQPLDSLANDSI